MLSAMVYLAASQSSWPRGDQMEKELLATLDKHFYNAQTKTWKEMAGKPEHVFLWGYTVLMSTFAIGAKVDPATYKPRMEAAFEGLESYWTKKAPGGYAVLPGQGRNPDRYYDDNAWVGLAAMEAFDVTKEGKYLEVAKRALTFVASGEDDKLGGGIYWHENEKNSKNACVSGPGACLAYRLFDATKDSKYRAMGDRWLAWTEKLIDPKDSLVMDNMKLDGKIERTKWSYNTAMVILAKWHALRNAGHNGNGLGFPSGSVAVVHMAEQASAKWIDDKSNLINSPGMFAMHLIEAEMVPVLFASPNWNNARGYLSPWSRARPNVEAVYATCRNSDGLLGEWWNRPPKKNEQLKLMYTASLLRTLLLVRS